MVVPGLLGQSRGDRGRASSPASGNQAISARSTPTAIVRMLRPQEGHDQSRRLQDLLASRSRTRCWPCRRPRGGDRREPVPGARRTRARAVVMRADAGRRRGAARALRGDCSPTTKCRRPSPVRREPLPRNANGKILKRELKSAGGKKLQSHGGMCSLLAGRMATPSSSRYRALVSAAHEVAPEFARWIPSTKSGMTASALAGAAEEVPGPAGVVGRAGHFGHQFVGCDVLEVLRCGAVA